MRAIKHLARAHVLSALVGRRSGEEVDPRDMHHSFRTQAPGEGGKADDVQPETDVLRGIEREPTD